MNGVLFVERYVVPFLQPPLAGVGEAEMLVVTVFVAEGDAVVDGATVEFEGAFGLLFETPTPAPILMAAMIRNSITVASQKVVGLRPQYFRRRAGPAVDPSVPVFA